MAMPLEAVDLSETIEMRARDIRVRLQGVHFCGEPVDLTGDSLIMAAYELGRKDGGDEVRRIYDLDVLLVR